MTATDKDLFLDGPDQIKPADSIRTWTPDGVVKLRSNADPEHISVITQFERTVKKYAKRIAIRYKVETSTKEVTFSECEQICRTVAKAFLKLGLEKHHGVGILGYNAPEWIYSSIAAILAGGCEAGIYTTSTPEAVLHCLKLIDANIIVVEDDVQLKKVLPIKDKLSSLKVIIQYSGKPTVDGIYAWDDVVKIGEKEPEDTLLNVQKTIAINECCTIIYTSGTTGLPKAVMLHHDNIVQGTKSMKNTFLVDDKQEVTLCYLPMNHIASQMMDIFLPLLCGTGIYIADKNCLKNTLAKNLKECRPDIFLGVPRVWEKLKEELMSYEANCYFPKRWILAIAKQVALNHYRCPKKGYHCESVLYRFFQRTVYKTMKSVVGLENCKSQLTGGAPTLPEIIDYFYSLDIPMFHGYGLSEASGMCTTSRKEDFPPTHVGKVKDEIIQVKILNPDKDGNGEICLYGRGVFMGYLNNEQSTLETIEPDGWMHSGDVGSLDDDLKLTITGRIKEIIITAGGENIPAPLIENTVKSYLPVVGFAVLIGDKRKYLTMLLTLKSEVDPATGIPTDRLAEETKEWCRSLGCNCDTIGEIIRNKPDPVYKAIQEGINRANKDAISNAQKVQKFTILPQDFSLANEELGPTLKLKRPVIYKKYAEIIDEMYK